MQPTYYERLLADEQLGLASILDGDIAQLTTTGSLRPAVEDASLIDCRSRYIRNAMLKARQDIAAGMSPDQFQRYQQTPTFHEVLVQPLHVVRSAIPGFFRKSMTEAESHLRSIEFVKCSREK